MTLFIIIITTVVSILAFSQADIFERLKFNPWLIKNSRQWYRFFTYGLLHADWIHLLINMMVLYSFGDNVEQAFRLYFGPKATVYYLALYIGALAISVIASYQKQKENYSYNAVGASGAVSAVVFSSIILFPWGKIFLFLIPFPIPAPIFGILYLIYSAWMARKAQDNIGHDAHFWGAVFGIVFTIALKPVLFLYFLSNLTHM